MKLKLKNSLASVFPVKLWQRSLLLVWSAVPGLTILWSGLLILQGLLPGATVYLTKLTIDRFAATRNAPNDDSNFNQTFLLFALVGISLLFTEVLRYVSDWVHTAQAETFSDYLKDILHIKAAEVDLEFYESAEYHDLMEQARGESQTKPLALLENFGSVLQNVITLISFGALLLAYGWAIPLLLLVGTLPGLYVSLKFDRIYHRWWKKTAHDRRWLMYFDSMLSHGDAAAEMRLFDLSARFRNKYQTLRQSLRAAKLAHLRRQFGGKIAANTLTLLAATVAVGWIALRVYYNRATLGDLAVFYQVFSRGQVIVGALLGNAGQSISNGLYLENLFAYLDLRSKVVSPETPASFPKKIKHGVHFKNITFHYPGAERAAVSGFSLFIPAGRKVAIVGVNGAGKSTLIKLLCRFYDLQNGAIEIDGTDIRRFDVKELRRNISVLFQFPMQFHETVADSIALGDTALQPDIKKIQVAAHRAGADPFIDKLPGNYEALLGKWFVKGCELSGGEWQKIALARAYFRQAQLTVLDEPTSFMDSWGEVDWFDRFCEMTRSSTSLLITHRFTIAMRADIIHVIDEGNIIESGSHSELLRLNGFYAQSWKSQMQVAFEQQIGV